MSNIIVYRDKIFLRSEEEFLRRQYIGFHQLRPIWIARSFESPSDPSLFNVGPIFRGVPGLAFKIAGRIPDIAAVRALGAVCVHAQFGRGGALALPLAQALGIPLVVTFHGGDAYKHAHYRRWPIPALFRLRLRRLIDYASLFVCVSEGVRERLLARGFPEAKTQVLPIGTDPVASEPRASPGRGIVFVGRFVEMKGVPTLIEAVRRLRQAGCREPVVLIGDGPDRPAIEQSAAKLEGVEFRGWQTASQVREAIRGARVVCIPSVVARSGEAEGLPSVAVEAMGQGVPVIASSDAGVAGLIVSGISGLIFPARDPSALAAALGPLLADDRLALAMGTAALATVADRFDAKRQSRRLEGLLIQAAASSPRSQDSAQTVPKAR